MILSSFFQLFFILGLIFILVILYFFSIFSLPQPSVRSLQHIYQVQLGRFFQDGEFMPEVKDSLFSIVSATIAMYYNMCKIMRPTPAKSHYTFNVRDLSQVCTLYYYTHNSLHLQCAGLVSGAYIVILHPQLTTPSVCRMCLCNVFYCSQKS